MKLRKLFPSLLCSGMLLVPVAFAQDKTPAQTTADQQKQNKADRDMTQQIRKAVEGDKTLSLVAHNVKIITRDGTVTLRGSVKTDEEKSAIESKATEIAGAGKVTNEIVVALPK
jgi:osmotically-inducible protein OsmY